MEIIRELPELLFRWLHLLFAIMWVGNSIFFNWLDAHLLPPEEEKEDVEGELWMLHGGGFFHVEKRPVIPGNLPETIHWFKWESYMTWITGFVLLSIVYYFTGGVFLVDPASELSAQKASYLGLAILTGGWLVYDGLWRSPLGRMGWLPILISLALLFTLAYFLESVFLGRGMYIHIGALLGTLMAGNVFFHIIPSQKLMMSAAERGEVPDPNFSRHAKQRSRQNNYMTFPVIFLMISAHFPSTYGHPHSWVVLAVLILGSAIVKHFMNMQNRYKNWISAAVWTAIITVVVLLFLVMSAQGQQSGGLEGRIVAIVTELLNLFARWAHVIFGFMWIGNSLFFNWMDLSLEQPKKPRKNVTGELWMLHGGVFLFVEKRSLSPKFIPQPLHWFKWEAYWTWITGFFLLGVVYYLSGGSYLVDPEIYAMDVDFAIALGIGVLIGGWLLYDSLWKSNLAKEPKICTIVSFLLLIIIAFALTHLLGGRAAFIHIGALLGTLMAANVFFHIIPFQERMMAAVANNQVPNPDWGSHAKGRSKHNNYMTFPLLFTMISNHFPATYGHEANWLLLIGLFFVSGFIKHLLNVPHQLFNFMEGLYTRMRDLRDQEDKFGGVTLGDIFGIMIVASFFVGFLFFSLKPQSAPHRIAVSHSPSMVDFQKVRAIIDQRCTTCHSANPSDPTVPVPAGVFFDEPEIIAKFASRIKARSVDSKTMPLGNKTGMTDSERKTLGEWIQAGSPIQ